MKPSKSNESSKGCVPTSSNCVVWQGECLDCIDLSTGDSISVVIATLATELCAIKDELDLTDLDLSCLFETCLNCPDPEKKIGNVLALLIAKVCDLDEIVNGTVPDEEVLADSITIASCFQTLDLNEVLITSMTLQEYTQAIGIKVCSILSTVTSHTNTLADHENRITVLEEAEPAVADVLQVTPVCVIAGDIPRDIDLVVTALEEQFCELKSVTGTPSQLSAAVAKQCSGLNSADRLGAAGVMSSISGWVSSVSTVSDAINNMWLTLCDLRDGVAAIQGCCTVTCADVIVDFFVSIVDNGATARIWFSGYSTIPSGFTDCNVAGSPMTLSDGVGGTYLINIDLAAAAADPNPIEVDLTATPLSSEFTYTFTLDSCLTNEDITCNKTVIRTASITASACSAPSNVSAVLT